jgi:hypothetical protein
MASLADLYVFLGVSLLMVADLIYINIKHRKGVKK